MKADPARTGAELFPYFFMAEAQLGHCIHPMDESHGLHALHSERDHIEPIIILSNSIYITSLNRVYLLRCISCRKGCTFCMLHPLLRISRNPGVHMGYIFPGNSLRPLLCRRRLTKPCQKEQELRKSSKFSFSSQFRFQSCFSNNCSLQTF